MEHRVDRELEEFRRIMEVPSTFEEGFRWSSLFGAIFVALLMVPGAIYMGLLAGTGIGSAAQWVTVILFIEVARRAHRYLNRSEIFVLFFMAGSMMGAATTGGLLWQQFFAQSDAAAANGLADQLPRWWAAPLGSDSYAKRTFFHIDWLPAILMMIFGSFVGQLSNVVLGYGLFRIASDMERLPFPMAPIGAQGIMAMAEDIEAKDAKTAEESWRWRVFAIGGALGLAFGSIYLFLPVISGALTGTAIQIFPIPFSDFTSKTGLYLKAVATGISWDFGNIITGMVMPFYGMVGSFIGLIITVVANPILYNHGILSNWKFGDDTVSTLFKNNIDFYFSLHIGIAVAIALAGIYQVVRSVLKSRRASRQPGGGPKRGTWKDVPPGRGDIKGWIILLCYFVITCSYIGVSIGLLMWHHGGWTKDIRNVLIVLLILGFFYTPLTSYVTARLEGMVGQVVEVPMIREAALILSGYHGVAVWFLPLPIANYGTMTVFYRQCELTGTKFTSIWKTKIILFPLILLSTIFFMNFIWGLDRIPSVAYPFAQRMWELTAANRCIMYSSTMGEFSMFEQAFNVTYLSVGAVAGVVLFGGMQLLGAPIMLTYGVVRGLGQSLPHSILPQFLGALIGQFYFKKRLKLKWRQYIPVVAAGFSCGMGLITTVGVGVTFLSKAVIKLPF
ncbi:MAG: peptide transporter [Lentisphaerae bacterium]|jgi:hypothetical protein|nr:peptide transporter [Lentisphaerota bacterium]